MDPYRFAYLLLVVVAFLIWLLIFCLRKDLRKQMLVMSGLASLLGITQLLYVGTYWTPEYAFPLDRIPIGIEDFLICAFFYGGIGSVLYKVVSNQTYICRPAARTRFGLFARILPLVAGLATFLVLTVGTHVNIIYTSTSGMLATALVLVILRPIYAKAVFANGVLFSILAITLLAIANSLFPGFIVHTWNLSVLSGTLIFGVPIEEFYFHFAAGACFAVAYERLFGRPIASA